MFDVITIGAATRDVFVKSAAFEVHDSDQAPYEHEACFPMGAKIDIDELVFETGGGATNAAATLSRLGFNTATVCAVGDDSIGRDILQELNNDSIADNFIQRIEGQSSGYSIIIVAGSGERTILVHRGAARQIAKENVSWDDVNAKMFYITSLGGDLDTMQTALSQAKNCGAKVAWNPGNSELKLGLEAIEPLIKQVDVLNLNLEEAAMLANEESSELDSIIERLRTLPKQILVITDGRRGAYAVSESEVLHVTPIDVPRINTTGAGDAFGSGFAAGLLKENDVRYALVTGIWNAAGCIQLMGAKRGLLESFPDKEKTNQVVIKTWK